MNHHDNKNVDQNSANINPNQQQNVQDERDQKIKNEEDTARIRSERQSVLDAEKNNKKED
jgi:hypothetical protein